MALPQIPTAGGGLLARVSLPPFQGDVMGASLKAFPPGCSCKGCSLLRAGVPLHSPCMQATWLKKR